ncbi:anti-sigma-D factor RsdA [Phytohabitans sp. LJ34]|uniref:anti-sigma-D factor RsdA n=1 Tax=Phytohabitans sp. LJ34 TaxID=3452217 RepID=UPI003F8BD717
MTDRGKAEQPVSVAQIAADDRLLDALGRGEPVDDDLATDPAAAMLAAWRADLDADEVFLDEPVSAPPLPAGDPRRKRRLVQAILGAAAAAVFAVGLAITAHQAQPGSVLWPVSKVVYPQRAEVKAAEKAIADAREALAEGRPADARSLLATAAEHIARIDDRDTAARLRAEVDALLSTLNAATAPPPAATTPAPGTSTPPPSPRTSPPGSSGGTKPAPPPEGGDPAPEPSTSSGGLLPDLPLPTPLLPLPPLPLPTLPPILPGGD